MIGGRISGSADSTRKWTTALTGLGPTWSFKDSWASNLTAFAALFVGLFGAADVPVLIPGDNASVLAITVIASAIALALIGSAALLVFAPPARPVAGGELPVMVLAARQNLKLGPPRDGLLLMLIAALLLLIVYGFRNLFQTLEAGGKRPHPVQPASCEFGSSPAAVGPRPQPWSAQ
ncbi:hypothetical protein [Streptomyces flavidovirens]|uniref:hypothetical protein n=1 Tax=Streptomyces flavidovirens TaxID=67298 RepID=UPI0036CCA26B